MLNTRSNNKNKGGELVKYKLIIAAAIVSAATAAGAADKKYGVGVTDTEIKLGETIAL